MPVLCECGAWVSIPAPRHESQDLSIANEVRAGTSEPGAEPSARCSPKCIADTRPTWKRADFGIPILTCACKGSLLGHFEENGFS